MGTRSPGPLHGDLSRFPSEVEFTLHLTFLTDSRLFMQTQLQAEDKGPVGPQLSCVRGENHGVHVAFSGTRHTHCGRARGSLGGGAPLSRPPPHSARWVGGLPGEVGWVTSGAEPPAQMQRKGFHVPSVTRRKAQSRRRQGDSGVHVCRPASVRRGACLPHRQSPSASERDPR